MKTEVRDTLLRVGLPCIGIAVVLAAAHYRRYSRTDLGLCLPAPTRAAIWFAAFVALAVFEELIGPTLGVAAPERWGTLYSPSIKVVRVAAMVILAPISEELVFRGLLYHVLSTTAAKPLGAIALTALAFTLMHVQYGYQALLFVLVDGVFYGTVRYSTGSILLTMCLHALGNAYAAYQRW